MFAVRRLQAHRRLVALLCAATLLLKLLVPTGYMIGSQHGRVTIELCPGFASPPMAMAGMPGDMPDHGKARGHGKAEMPCAFSALSVASLGAIDPVHFVALIVFILAVGRRPAARPAAGRQTYLRPPLRGPPAIP